MSEAIAMVNDIYQRRGYLVIGSYDKYSPGDLVNRMEAWGEEVPGQAVILSTTDEDDFVVQMHMTGRFLPKPETGGWNYYYRVVTE